MPERNGIAILKRACVAAARYANGHRKLAAVGGCLLLAALVVTWKVRPGTPARPDHQAPAVVLDKVKVFPPPETRERPDSDSTDTSARGTEPGRFPQVAAKHSAGPQFPAVTNATESRLANPAPQTPRAVWLTGKIEDVEPPAPRIQSTGHAEPPFTPRQAGLTKAPQVLHRRR